MGYEISLSGLLVGASKIAASQNNIANIETPGYARERVEVYANTTSGAGAAGLQIGSGVTLERVIRITNELTTQQARQEKGHVGYYNEMSADLKVVETIFNELGEGSLGSLMGSFFQSWEELSKFPEQSSYRADVLKKSEQFAEKLNSLIKQTDVSISETNQKIEVHLEKTNELIKKIAKVNGEIAQVGPQQSPNALYDERDRYIDELSTYVDVKVKQNFKNPNFLDVEVGGNQVVSGTDAATIDGYYKQSEDEWVIGIKNIEIQLKSGMVKANLDIKNNYLKATQDQLHQLANVLIGEVNAIHQTGYGLDGTTGIPFFMGTDARTISVNPLLVNSYEKLATSGVNGVVGNVDIANQIVALQNKKMYAGATTTADNFYQGIVVELGTNVSQMEDQFRVHEGIYNGIEAERQKVQGVNMDEEMMNLMQYQKYYQANAKALQVYDEMNETLIGIFR